MEILEYQTSSGRRPFLDWLEDLGDNKSKAVILNRLKRVRQGQFGDHRHISAGVWELRFFFGPGYRVYYLLEGQQLVILLGGGEKDTQNRDIEKAKGYALDYWERK